MSAVSLTSNPFPILLNQEEFDQVSVGCNLFLENRLDIK